MGVKSYEPEALSQELLAAQLPIAGVDSDGRITWATSPTEEQVATGERVKADHDATTAMAARENARKSADPWKRCTQLEELVAQHEVRIKKLESALLSLNIRL